MVDILPITLLQILSSVIICNKSVLSSLYGTHLSLIKATLNSVKLHDMETTLNTKFHIQ